MIVEGSSDTGILDIFTSDEPDGVGGFEPKKTPYLVINLRVPLNENLSALYSLGLKYTNNAQGQVDGDEVIINVQRQVDSNEVTVVITGRRNIIKAIDIINKELMSADYLDNRNEPLKNHLHEYQQKISEEIKNKKPPLPPKSKLDDLYHEDKTAAQTNQKKITVTTVYSSKKPHKKYIRKENKSSRKISEIEAFNGLCYRVLLGDRHPKVRSVHDKSGNRVAVLSEKIQDFINLFDYVRNKQRISKQTLLKTEIVKIWVASYVEEETDLHVANYGFNHSDNTNPSNPMYAVKIDDDRTTWSLTSKYFGFDPNKDTEQYRAPARAFKFTERDIQHFPNIEDSKPDHWPNQEKFQDLFEKNAISELMKERKYNDDKYYMFLKRILIPDSVYESFGQATISSEKTRNKLVAHKCNKTKELRKLLLNVPEFRQYLIKNQSIIDMLKTDFGLYNNDYKKQKNDYLKINLSDVNINFQQLVKEAKEIEEEKEKIKIQKARHSGFFTRHPNIKNALIGTAVGLLVIGSLVSVVASFGATLGLTLGGLALLGGSLAATAGMGAGAVGAVALLSVSIGVLVREFQAPPVLKKHKRAHHTTPAKLHKALSVNPAARKTSNDARINETVMIVEQLKMKTNFYTVLLANRNTEIDLIELFQEIKSTFKNDTEMRHFKHELSVLKGGSDVNIKIILSNNDELRKFLIKNQDNSVITQWTSNHSKSEVTTAHNTRNIIT